MKQVKLLFIITILIFSKVSHSQLSQHLTSTTYPEVIIENGTDYSTSPDNITVSPELTILELPGTNNSGMLPADMVYISALDKLYIAGMSGIQVVNTNINSIENSMQYTCGRYTEWDASDWPNRRIEYQYNSTANRYEIFWLSETGNIFIYDASNCQRVQTLNIGDEYHKSRQISINPYTEELIAVTNYALETLPYKAEFTAFSYNTTTQLYEKIIYSPLVSLPQLAYNSNTNTICIPAGDRSKIFLMDANFERKRIIPGIQWISFPRLDRSANNAVDATDLLEMINIPPTYCEIEHQGIVSNADFQPPNWIWNQTNMDEIISSKGYKLTTTYIGSSPENVFIDIHGSRVSPTTYMSVTHQHENWLGYFLPYTCHVEDAFRKCWDDIKIIKTQKWSMVRLAPGTPFLSYPQDPYLYDGDMVVVEMFDNAYFQWDQPAIPILDVAVQEPQYFSWQEEPDYVPVVVELDPNDPADEVAVFVNNECQGAAVVTGTTNTINAYILDNSSIGDTMEIVTYTSSAKENKVKKHKGYFIFNPETGKSTKTVLTKNNWSYYYLPLKNTTADIDKYSFNRLSIYPNPTTNKITWRLFLSEPDHIVYHIFDSKGQEILKVDQGYHQAGNHSSTVDLKAYNLRPGVYFFHVAGNKINLVKKIVVR